MSYKAKAGSSHRRFNRGKRVMTNEEEIEGDKVGGDGGETIFELEEMVNMAMKMERQLKNKGAAKDIQVLTTNGVQYC
ncbi:hypothetical protein JCGZ_22313 [Jatropha curcas]|uniref:Uncharacterized protein n=1 Tax=Jatropha curcas TaxID=180498 RepID=A0A067JQW0_JATCU|nr:hypothetical protein JCGZ_22313 [Jatropha curcas]